MAPTMAFHSLRIINYSRVSPSHIQFAELRNVKHAVIAPRVRIERHDESNNVSPSQARVLHRIIESLYVGETSLYPSLPSRACYDTVK